MNFRPVLSLPLPWLTLPFHLLFGGKGKGVEWQKALKLPRTLSFTKEGKLFTIALLLIGVGAINTGNNLLYLVDSMLLSLIIISGIMSEATLKRIRVTCGMPTFFHAGRATLVSWKITNGSRRTASYSFIVEEQSVEELDADDIYTVKLPPLGAVTRHASYTFHNRGVYRLHGFTVSTRFPFGLFRKGKDIPLEREVVVFPAIRPVRHHPVYSSMSGNRLRNRRGGGILPYSLRDYTTSDDARLIHWKSTAKSSKVIAREFEEETEKKVLIVLDNYGKKGYDERLETAIEEAASLAHLFITRGYGVGLKTTESETPCGEGKEHLYRLLKVMALLTPCENGKDRPAVKVVGL